MMLLRNDNVSSLRVVVSLLWLVLLLFDSYCCRRESVLDHNDINDTLQKGGIVVVVPVVDAFSVVGRGGGTTTTTTTYRSWSSSATPPVTTTSATKSSSRRTISSSSWRRRRTTSTGMWWLLSWSSSDNNNKEDNDNEDVVEEATTAEIVDPPSDVEEEQQQLDDNDESSPSGSSSSSSPVPPPPAADEIDVYTKEKMIFYIQSLGAISGRGEFASKKQKDSASSIIEKLERFNPTSNPTTSSTTDQSSSSSSLLIDGRWELVYCSTQLFRSSPFFMAGRDVCTTDVQRIQYDWFCDMHRKALAISTIGPVRQIIDTSKGKLVSEFEVKAGAIPFIHHFIPSISYSGGLPFTIDGAIVSTADIQPTFNGTAFEIYMDTVEIKGSNIPLLRKILDKPSVKLQTRSLSNILERSISSTYYTTTPKPIFRVTYLDDTVRISRDQDDNIYCYIKTSKSCAITNYTGIDDDLGLFQFLESFNNAITRFYL